MSWNIFSQTITGLSSTFGLGSSLIWIPNTCVSPFNIGVGCIVSSTGTQTYSVEHTFDYTGSSVFISSNATWFANSTLSGATTSLTGNYAFPVSAIRLNVTAGTSQGTVTMKLIQASD